MLREWRRSSAPVIDRRVLGASVCQEQSCRLQESVNRTRIVQTATTPSMAVSSGEASVAVTGLCRVA